MTDEDDELEPCEEDQTLLQAAFIVSSPGKQIQLTGRDLEPEIRLQMEDCGLMED